MYTTVFYAFYFFPFECGLKFPYAIIAYRVNSKGEFII